jgi:hypothetical protein
MAAYRTDGTGAVHPQKVSKGSTTVSDSFGGECRGTLHACEQLRGSCPYDESDNIAKIHLARRIRNMLNVH